VPDKALLITRAKLRWPSYAEGFEALYQVRLAPEGGFLVTRCPSGPW
jgi:hypothetical protein